MTDIDHRADAEAFKTSSAAVTVWRQRHADFPDPLVSFRSGPLYSRREVVLWLVKTGRVEATPHTTEGLTHA